jgi:hypothetical protein
VFICVRSVAERLICVSRSPLFLLAVAGVVSAEEPAIRLVEQDGRPVAFEAVHVPEQAAASLTKVDSEELGKALAVYVGRTATEGQPAIVGKHELSADTLRFTPSFPLKAGLDYRIELNLPASGGNDPLRLEKIVSLPAAPRPAAAQVTKIYPTAATLPENQLRFYLHFSAPMRRGEAYEHLQLLAEDGKPVHAPFLELGEELWDPSATRLTLLIDPGRIKKGLTPREEHGPVLTAGGKYQLVVTKGWRDASGQVLAEDFTKTFTAGPAIERVIDEKTWKVGPPRPGSRAPLVVRFPYPLDHALLGRTITVESAAGQRLDGEVTVGPEEKSWEFRPDQPWNAGAYDLVIDTVLEDQAGNRVGRPFEVDQFTHFDKSSAPEFVRLPFKIVPGRE